MFGLVKRNPYVNGPYHRINLVVQTSKRPMESAIDFLATRKEWLSMTASERQGAQTKTRVEQVRSRLRHLALSYLVSTDANEDEVTLRLSCKEAYAPGDFTAHCTVP